MILADKIINERKKNGWSQEELADRLGVSRQSVSKWESAQSVPDMQRILEMSRLFGVTTDYLLKDEMEDSPVAAVAETDPPRRRVTLDEAQSYLAARRVSAPRIALGVALCILGASVLVLLVSLGEYGLLGFTENVGSACGVVFLLICIAVGVALMITSGLKNEQYEWLEKEVFDAEYGVEGLARERRRTYKQKYGSFIAVGVVLCIVALVPLLVSEAFSAPEYVQTMLVSVLLFFIAAAVWMFVFYGILISGADVLLQEGDHTPEKKRKSRVTGTVAGAYWLICTAAFLAWSFATDSWDRTWIVWPVAGVLFPVVMGVTGLFTKDE